MGQRFSMMAPGMGPFGANPYAPGADVLPSNQVPYAPGVDPDSQGPGMSTMGMLKVMGPKAGDWLKDAVSFLMFGHGAGKNGEAPDHVAAGAKMIASPGNLSPEDVKAFWPELKNDTNYPSMGGQRVADEVDQPVVRPGNRDRGAGKGRGHTTTPSSPSTKTSSNPVTAQPMSNDPAALQQADRDRLANDPAMAQLKTQLARLDQQGGQLDLAPLAALSDAWSGGHLAQSYDRPLTTKQIEAMKTGIAEQLARRQADLEWHLDRNRAMQEIGAGHDAAHVAAAQTGADAREYAVDYRPAPAAKGVGKIPPENDPKSIKGAYMPVIRSHLGTDYVDPSGGKGVGGASVLVHDQLLEAAQNAVANNPKAYPTLTSAYKAALQHWQQGSMPWVTTGSLKRHTSRQPAYAGGGDGD